MVKPIVGLNIDDILVDLRNMRISRLFVFTFLILSLNSCGENTFRGEFGENQSDEFMDCIETEDGGIIITGRSEEGFMGTKAIVHKVDENGETVWTKYNPLTLQGNDICKVDGGYVYVGFKPTDRERMYEGDRTQAITVTKIDENGKMLWHQHLETDYNSTSSDVVALSDGNILILGSREWENEYYSTTWKNHSSYRFVKMDPDGKILFDTGKEENFYFNEVYESQLVVSDEGRIYMSGTINTYGNDYAFLIMEINENGIPVNMAQFNWKKSEYTSEWNWGYGLDLMSDGVVICGSAYYADGQRVVKMNWDLEQEWEAFVEGRDMEVSDLAAYNDEVFLAMENEERELRLASIEEGEIQWQKDISSTNSFDLGNLRATSSGYLLLAGSKHPSGNSDRTGLFFKFDRNGEY